MPTCTHEEVVPLDLDFFLSLETESGIPVRDIRLQGGHHLSYKIMDPEASAGLHGMPIIMPKQYRRRSVGNLAAIRAFMIATSCPFRRKHARRELYWDFEDTYSDERGNPIPKQKARWKVREGAMKAPRVRPGECIIYNSYNLAKIACIGLAEPLVIIRDLDIDVIFPKDLSVGLGEHALRSMHSAV